MYLYNKPNFKGLRKSLRNQTPSAERVLWKYLKSRRINNRKFRRQYSIGNYVVDFYCPEIRLAIELDGNTHFFYKEAEQKDSIRQKYIEDQEIKVLRFTNTDIYESINEVLDQIYQATHNPAIQ